MRNLRQALLALFALSDLGGCATVVHGTKQTYTITSSPPGAEVKLSNGVTCELTPCTVRLPRKKTLTATVEKAGYKTATATIEPSMTLDSGLPFVGNVFIGGIIGFSIDYLDGAYLELGPNPLTVQLESDSDAVATYGDNPWGPGPAPQAAPSPVPMSPPPASYAGNPTLAPASTNLQWSPQRQDLFARAYMMGQTQALRRACQGPEDQYWRGRMAGLIEAESGDQAFAHLLADSYNRGYDAARADFPGCDARTHAEEARVDARRRALGEPSGELE